MLQQTQTHRVVEPWKRFLERYPTPRALAHASLSDVLRQWTGLGFARRAKFLHEAARVMDRDYQGEVPREVAQLRALPGIGEYSANAIASFAFGVPVAILDTNVGRVLSRCVANAPLRPREARELAHALLPTRNSAAFNQAMLDLGAQFCRKNPACAACPLRQCCAWQVAGGPDPAPTSHGVSKPQSTFAGSNRQLRGQVLRVLGQTPHTDRQLAVVLNQSDRARLEHVLHGLQVDGLIATRRGRWFLTGD